MSRPVKWPPSIHVKRGRAFIRVRGEDHYLHGAPGSLEAQREYARLIALLADGAEPTAAATPAAPLTVADVIARWWDHAAAHYGARGRELEQHRYGLRPLRRLCGHLEACAFRVAQLEQVQAAMASGSWLTPEERAALEDRGQPVGWCRNVCHRRITRILTMCRWAERQGLLPEGRYQHLTTRSPLPRGGKGARETEPRRPCDFDEVKAAARQAPPPVAAMLLLQWWTGMRPGEARILRPCDVDTSGPVWLYTPFTHKTEHLGQPRVVPLGRKAQALLRPWLAAAPAADAYAFRPLKARRGKNGPQYRSGCYTVFALCQAVRRACARAGVDLTSYENRHAARQRIGLALGDNAARQVLGQVSLESTAKYARATDLKAAIEAARKLG